MSILDNTTALREVLDQANALPDAGSGGGGGSEKLRQLVDGSVTEITAEDLGSINKIKQYAFCNCTELTRVELPNTITEIGNNAFQACTRLEELNLPDGLMSIGTAALSATAIKEIVFPVGITTLPISLCNGANTLKIVCLGDITSIGAYALAGSYLGSSCLEFDFTHCTSVPTLQNINAFNYINSAAKIKVPSALYDEWIETTNWSDSTIASKIVAS